MSIKSFSMVTIKYLAMWNWPLNKIQYIEQSLIWIVRRYFDLFNEQVSINRSREDRENK